MKIKIWSLFLTTLIFSSSYTEVIKANSDEVLIDLNKNKVTAKEGISLSEGGVSGLFYEFERNPKTKEIKFSNEALVNIGQKSGNIKIQTEKGKISPEDKEGEFYETFAYINVAKTTGAEAPNDKIYFGSPYIKYENENIYAEDTWLTTDFKVVNFYKMPEKAGYVLKSKKMNIEPDKQITLYNTNLFVNKKDVTPFSFPWFRVNIRKDSKVPLFPTFSSSYDYGFETMWGFLYGNKKDKFRGGFAPKFSDKLGLLAGRWENWYKFDKIGETKLNIDDLLVYSKNKSKYNHDEKDTAEYEKIRKRYRVELSHNYSGEYGFFNFTSVNATRSMIDKLNDTMTKYEDNSIYESLKKKGYDIDRYKFDKNIGFYNLNTNLKNKDTSFVGDMKLVSDKKAYGLLVYDSIRDDGTSYSKDHDLYSNFKLNRDTKKYKLRSSYNYLYDLDPGSTAKDMMSKNEKIKSNFTHKKSGFYIDYSKRYGDSYRTLDFWESDISSTLRQRNVLGIDVNYVPKTVAKYKIDDYENLKVNFLDYKMGKYTFSPSVSYSFLEKELDQVESSFRKSNLGTGRISQYNRFYDTVYQKKYERRMDFNLHNKNETYKIALGNTEDKLTLRNGLFDGSTNTYENDSDFYEIIAKKENIDTSVGTIGLGAKFRGDKYENSSDKTNTLNLNANHEIDITDNLNNDFGVEYNRNLFSGNSKNKEQRLINKDDYIRLTDNIKYKTTNDIDLDYKIAYKLANKSYGKKEKSQQNFSNSLDFAFDKNKNLKLNYSEDKRYNINESTGKNFNDLKNRNYGVSYTHDKHNISFEAKSIDFNLKNFNSKNDSAKEKMRQNRIKYSYKFNNSKLSLFYSEGKNKVNTTTNKKINRKNTEYSVLYNIYGDVEHDFYVSYKKYDYGNKTIGNYRRNTDVYKLSYAYRDKRFEKEELIKYATLEYDKSQEHISLQDIENMRTILDRKRDFRDSFELTRIEDESFIIGNYKRTFNTYLTLEKNNARYSQTGDFKDSFSKIEGGLKYSYNRVGVGYNFKENSGWNKKSNKWEKRNREHEFSLFAKIGKPSQGWKVKSYAKIYDNISEEQRNKDKRKKAIDGIGIEIGKEMDYYEWAISYENKYNSSKRDYEWKAGLHFTLLTFPNNSLFGVGADNNNSKRKVRPDAYLLDRPRLLDKKDF